MLVHQQLSAEQYLGFDDDKVKFVRDTSESFEAEQSEQMRVKWKVKKLDLIVMVQWVKAHFVMQVYFNNLTLI